MTELNDGYGDNLTVDEVLGQYESWLHARAHQMLASTDHRHEDLVQEGRIAMWRALQQHDPAKGALPSWLTQHATWHMHQVLSRGGTWTGKPRGASTSRVEVKVHSVESLDQILHPDADSGRAADTAAGGATPDLAEEAMQAYHRGEIAEAIALLSAGQQRYVRLRFVEDLKGAEMKDAFGYDPSALWNSARNGAKYKLRAHLSHLEAA
ncbi:sigma-70 family RNA polymerase sigma factor [Streptomyces sp. NPDC005562]|uniref:RNA polymerase sigma factor n=1 Tax=Streptomyces sp. NPDC005562 TaxID=3154890 RepID=UPI0033B1CE6F